MDTITETIFIDNQLKKRSTEKSVIEAVHVNNNNKGENVEELDSYDATLPSNDPKFMKPLRKLEKRLGFKTPLIWTNIILLTLIQAVTLFWAMYFIYERKPIKLQSILFVWFLGYLGGFGVTGGAHRLWTHKSYKAKTPLKILLLFCYSIAGQYSLLYWVRDHRVHHKFSETEADPHDANRGFFFSHIGWFMMKRHPAVLKEGQNLDFSDITNDPIVRFHIKYHNLFKLAFCFVIPAIIPVVCWGESWAAAIFTQPLLRFVLSLHSTWSVNSFAHIWGNHPYDKNIMPAENWIVSMFTLGEGWHNYHHTFPWDYKAAEMPYTFNMTTLIIDGFAKIGWAYDLKSASPSIVKAVAANRGTLVG